MLEVLHKGIDEQMREYMEWDAEFDNRFLEGGWMSLASA